MNSANSASDIAYAATDDGVRLPVIDITQPAFALPDDPASIAALDAAYRASELRYALIPRFVMNFMMRAAARRSRLLADVLDPDTSFLAGLTTYIMKLSAETLPPPFDSDTDRQLVSSPQLTAMRLRLQQTVKLLAGALDPLLLADPAAPLFLINIGGGAAARRARRRLHASVLRLERAGTARRYPRPCGGPKRDHRGVLRGRLVRIRQRRCHRRQSQGAA